jgi:hypothetical protein
MPKSPAGKNKKKRVRRKPGAISFDTEAMAARTTRFAELARLPEAEWRLPVPYVLSQTKLPTTIFADLLPVTTSGSHFQRPRGWPTKATGAPLGAGALTVVSRRCPRHRPP